MLKVKVRDGDDDNDNDNKDNGDGDGVSDDRSSFPRRGPGSLKIRVTCTMMDPSETAC